MIHRVGNYTLLWGPIYKMRGPKLKINFSRVVQWFRFAQTAEMSRVARIKRWLIRSLLFILFLILILTLLLWTQAGSRWLIERVANQYDVRLQEIRGNLIEGFDIGELNYEPKEYLGTPETANFQSKHKRLKKITATKLSFRWQPLGLLYTAVKLQQVSVDELQIELYPDDGTQDQQEWPSFAQPYLIELNKFHVNRLSWKIQESKQALNNLTGSMTLGAFHLTVNQLRAQRDDLIFDANGKMGVRFPYTFDLAGHVEHKQSVATSDPKKLLNIQYNLSGDFTQADLSARILLGVVDEKAKVSSVLKNLVTSTTNPRTTLENGFEFNATVKTHYQEKHGLLPKLRTKTSQLKSSLTSKTKSDSAAKAIQEKVEIEFNLLGDISNLEDWITVGVAQKISKTNFSAKGKLSVAQPISSTSSINIAVTEADAVFSLHNNKIHVTAPAQVPVSWNDQGQIRVGINFQDAKVAFNSTESKPANKLSQTKLGLSGDINFSLQLPSDQTSTKILEFSTQLDLGFQKFDAASIHKSLTSDLNGNMHVKATYQPDQGFGGEINARNISGVLNQESFNLNGIFQWEKNLVTHLDLGAILGKNSLNLKSNLKTNSLAWELKVPEIKQLEWMIKDTGLLEFMGGNQGAATTTNSPLQGSIESQGSFSGNLKNPKFDLTLKAKAIAWQDLSLDELNARVVPSITGEHQLDINAKSVKWKDAEIDAVKIKSDGKVSQHRLQMNLSAHLPFENQKIEVDAIFDAGLMFGNAKNPSGPVWRGRWKVLNLKSNHWSDWQLETAESFSVDSQKILAEKTCLTMTASHLTPAAAQFFNRDNYSAIEKKSLIASAATSVEINFSMPEKTKICLSAAFNVNAKAPQNKWSAQGELTSVPAEFLSAWLKADTHLIGYADGHFSAWQKVNGFVAGNASFNSRGLALVYQFQDEAAEIYRINHAYLSADLANQEVKAQTQWDLGRYGYLTANGKYNLINHMIQVKLKTELTSLAPLEAIVPLLNNLEGKAAADINFGGTLEAPKITGNFSVQDATAKIPSLGLQLANLQFNAKSISDESFHLDARVTSGEGTLVVNGSLENFGKPNWRWDSNVFGANIRFIENPLLSATLNPNLRLQVTAKNASLTGSTEIPWAQARMKSLPATATRVSKDVVIINSGKDANSGSYAQHLGKEIKAQTQFLDIPFTCNVIVYFGDDVRFKGFGLDSQLVGKVNVLKEKDRQVFTTGFVGVGKGNYKAYGQELKIERGRLIFQGPYDNPGLDIRALREMENISAGLEIGGTLQHPRSSVFSVPATTPSEAMALLVTGKPLAQSSQADAYALLGAISTLGMDSEEGMSTDIAHLFSLDEISIKADKGLEQSSLLVGKYVTPKLFIRYVVGLFDQAFSVGMRYQLNEKFRLEAESGKTQSVDVIYKIER